MPTAVILSFNLSSAELRVLAGIPSAEAFGSSFLTIGSVGAVGPTTAAQTFQLFIEGPPGVFTPFGVRVNSLSGSFQLNGASTLQFSALDLSGAIRPGMAQRVLYLKGDEVFWAGTIEEIEEESISGTLAVTNTVKCNSDAVILSRRIVRRNYPSALYGTLQSVMADLQSYLIEEGMTWTDTGDPGVDLGDLVFNGVTLLDCLTQLAQKVGWDFRVDLERSLRFFDPAIGIGSAPVTIADNDGNWRNMKVKRSRGAYRNVQFVRSSQQVLQMQTDTFVVDNAYPQFILTCVPSPRPNYVNPIIGLPDYAVDMTSDTGGRVTMRGDWVADWYWAYFPPQTNEALKNYVQYNGTKAPLSIGSLVTFTYPVDQAIEPLVVVEDKTQIAARKAAEGGSGRYEAIEDIRDQISVQAMRQLAEAKLDRLGRNGFPVSVVLEVDGACAGNPGGVDGWEIGQILSIACTRPLVAGDFLIQQVDFREVDKAFLSYTITAVAGAMLPSWDNVYARMLTAQQHPMDRIEQKATFHLARTVDGVTNDGLQVGTNVTRVPYLVKHDGILKEAQLIFETPADDSATELSLMHIDQDTLVRTSITADTIKYAPTDTGLTTVRVFANGVEPYRVRKGDTIEVDVIATGAVAVAPKDGELVLTTTS